jgi:hypothetical protein
MAKAKDNGAQVHFWCPGCETAHGINPKTWSWNGSVENPTFSPSVLAIGPNLRCHSFVTDGKIQFLSDSKHALAGQTVDLPEWPYD